MLILHFLGDSHRWQELKKLRSKSSSCASKIRSLLLAVGWNKPAWVVLTPGTGMLPRTHSLCLLICLVTLSEAVPSVMHSQNSEDLACIELNIVELSNKYGSNALEDSGSIHVYSSSDWQDKTANPFVHTIVLLNTFNHGGQCC